MTPDLKKLREDWDTFGKMDPLWAVISWPEKRGGKWDVEELYRLGREEVGRILDEVALLELPLRKQRALDFGCGVGRLSEALAAHFDRVTGLDIAPSMVDYARLHTRSGGRVEYLVNETDDLGRFKDGEFDFILSSITLQHVPQPFISGYLREFVRVLAPGGMLVFQLPAKAAATVKGCLWRLLPRSAVASMLRRKNRLPVSMQMNAIPRVRVESILRQAGAEVVSVRRDTEAGPDWISYRYIAVKPSAESGVFQ